MMHMKCSVQHKSMSNNHQPLLLLYKITFYYNDLVMFLYAPFLFPQIPSLLYTHQAEGQQVQCSFLQLL